MLSALFPSCQALRMATLCEFRASLVVFLVLLSPRYREVKKMSVARRHSHRAPGELVAVIRHGLGVDQTFRLHVEGPAAVTYRKTSVDAVLLNERL